MPHHLAYCSACDRPVSVDYRAPRHRGMRSVAVDPSELVCLEYPARCTGSMCPMFSITRDVEASRDMRAVELRQ